MMTPQEKGQMNALKVLITMLARRFGPVIKFTAEEMKRVVDNPVEGFTQTWEGEEIIIKYDPLEGVRDV